MIEVLFSSTSENFRLCLGLIEERIEMVRVKSELLLKYVNSLLFVNFQWELRAVN